MVEPAAALVAGLHEQAHGGGNSRSGSGTMRVQAVILAAMLVLVPPGASAADLVVWWEEGFNPEEDTAVREIIAAFEQKSGQQVELVFSSNDEQLTMVLAALEAGHPPDFLYGQRVGNHWARWAHEGRLVDLADTLGPFTAQFDQASLEADMMLDVTTGRHGLYLLPMGRSGNYLHVWRSLLEQAGFTLADIPNEWEPFWSFWCDTVQPALRKATGRDDIYGIGLPMSVAGDTEPGFFQFASAYEADYVTRDGRLVIDEPLVRNRLVKVLDSYTAIYRKGCTPPDAVEWDSLGNNKAFLEQRVVLTMNNTLSIPNALKADRPDDYYKNTVTLAWPNNANGQPLAIRTGYVDSAVFKNGGHVPIAKEFVRFLAGEGWLAHWLDFTGDRIMPPMPALLETPFWLNPGDPHRMAAAMQFLTEPRALGPYDILTGDWRYAQMEAEGVWPKAIRRIVTEGIIAEQSTDEAIARIHQLLSE
jgi:multiple sugar transport system substrate-binding protein